MRVLWVKAGRLLPVDTGGKIRSFNLLRQLTTRHDLTLLSYYDGRRDETYESELRCHFSGAAPIATGGPETTASVALDYIRHLPSSAPYAVTKFTAAPVQEQVDVWLRERRFDVAVCDFLSASLNFPKRSDTPCVLFQHNVESVLWRRQAQHEANPFRKLAFRIEASKMARYERDAVRRFPHVIAVSAQDRDAMRGMIEPARISVVPTGVDVDAYRAAAADSAADPIVLFLGSMDWEPNIDAVEYFCRDMWPAITTRVPGARFRIVGRNPSARVTALASESIEVTGTVASVLDHLREAAVFVVPLRIGGGTRLKIFEAMAAGRAVVSTRVGAEGLAVRDGQDILLADTAVSFAEAVCRLLQDPHRRHTLAQAAAALAARHDWSEIANQFERVLESVVSTTSNEARRLPQVAQVESTQHA